MRRIAELGLSRAFSAWLEANEMQHRFKRTLRHSAGRLARPAQVCTLTPTSTLRITATPALTLAFSLSLSLS